MKSDETDADRIVFIDDDSYILESTVQAFAMEGMDVDSYSSADEFMRQADLGSIGVIICDLVLPGTGGVELMEKVRKHDVEIPFILITGQGDIATAVQAMRDGAEDFIEKSFDVDTLIELARKVVSRRKLLCENRKLREQLALSTAPGHRLLGNAPSILQLRNQIVRLADTSADVLLFGETGAGKEVVARSLHELSSRKNRPFVAINCGGLPENIIESELFGHAAGAFTGANKARLGKFEHAYGGTVFLDEIESMPMDFQVKLLRVLQERYVEPLGSNRQVAIDVRIVAATKVDLRNAVTAGTFREDLYYRLNVLTLQLPALRQRIEDIPMLFHHFAVLAASRYECDIPEFRPELMQELASHDWPGNIRELKNAAERFVLLGGETSSIVDESVSAPVIQNLTLQQRVEWFEKFTIERALEETAGSINNTVETLGTPRKTLYEKMRKISDRQKSFQSKH